MNTLSRADVVTTSRDHIINTKTVVKWQRFSRLALRPVIKRIATRVQVDFDPSELDPTIRYVVASNHQSLLDSFTELAAIPEPIFAKIGPFRAMTLNKFLRGGPVRFGAVRMGCFPSKPHDTLPHGIEFSKELLRSGQTVFICPEGRRVLQGERTARPGVAVLAREPNVRILPTHIQWTRYGRWRRSFSLTFGRPFDGSQMTAQEILGRIYALEV